MRFRSLSQEEVIKLSSHQVAPASSNERTVAAARLRLLPGVVPPTTMSKGAADERCFLTNFLSSRTSAGVIRSIDLYFCGMIPSHLSARCIDFALVQTPGIQTGILGD